MSTELRLRPISSVRGRLSVALLAVTFALGAGFLLDTAGVRLAPRADRAAQVT